MKPFRNITLMKKWGIWLFSSFRWVLIGVGDMAFFSMLCCGRGSDRYVCYLLCWFIFWVFCLFFSYIIGLMVLFKFENLLWCALFSDEIWVLKRVLNSGFSSEFRNKHLVVCLVVWYLVGKKRKRKNRIKIDKIGILMTQ